MNEQSNNDNEWFSRLVSKALPFDIQRKIVNCESLTKKELNQFATLLILAKQAETVPKIMSTSETCDQLLELVARMEKRQVEHGRTLHTIDVHTTPPIDGLEELFKDNTQTQRDMFLTGFRLLKSRQFEHPRTAATFVFDDFKRRRVPGRYDNKFSFCTLFARKWDLYCKRPRI